MEVIMPDSKGRFGIHGGQYIPETLMNAVIELEEAYNHYKNDPGFNKELTELLNEYAGRPSNLYPDISFVRLFIKAQSICFPISYDGKSVVGKGAPVGQGKGRSIGHAFKRETVLHLVGYEYGIPLLELLQESLAGRYGIGQQRQYYEEQNFHLLANSAMRPFT